jgi:hypothetical protein
MAAKRQSAPVDRLNQDKLLKRIAGRYEQLDEKLEELEAKLLELDDREAEEPTPPRKPR